MTAAVAVWLLEGRYPTETCAPVASVVELTTTLISFRPRYDVVKSSAVAEASRCHEPWPVEAELLCHDWTSWADRKGQSAR